MEEYGEVLEITDLNRHEVFRENPWELLFQLEIWMKWVEEGLALIQAGKPHEFDRRFFNGVAKMIGMWCDMEDRAVDPTPILLLTRQIIAAADPQNLFFCSKKQLNASFRRAVIAYERLYDAYELRTKLWKAGNTGSDQLVDVDDVARTLHMQKRSLEKHRKHWPPPDVKGKGQTPDRWHWKNLLPILREQFAHKTIPDAPAMRQSVT